MKGDADSPHRRTGARSAEPTWLTLGQAAKYLGIAQSTVRVWTDSGRLPVFYTPGGHRRFLRSDLDAFIQRNGAGSRPRGDAVVLVVDDNPTLRSFMRVNLEVERGQNFTEKKPRPKLLIDQHRTLAMPA